MRRFNPDKVSWLIAEIRRVVHRLRDLGKLPEEDFLKDQDKIDSAKYNFIVAIEATIDLSNHIIAQNGFRTPRDYADTFRVLEEEGAFPEDFAARLQDMARLRNRLVHLYWEIEDTRLYRILKENLNDFGLFLEAEFIGLEKV